MLKNLKDKLKDAAEKKIKEVAPSVQQKMQQKIQQTKSVVESKVQKQKSKIEQKIHAKIGLKPEEEENLNLAENVGDQEPEEWIEGELVCEDCGKSLKEDDTECSGCGVSWE